MRSTLIKFNHALLSIIFSHVVKINTALKLLCVLHLLQEASKYSIDAQRTKINNKNALKVINLKLADEMIYDHEDFNLTATIH